MLDIPAILRIGPVIATLDFESEENILPIAQALLEGGVRVLEISTLSPIGIKAIKNIGKSFKEAVVGAGTVLTGTDVSRAVDAGAQFVVSPGFTIDVEESCDDGGIPLIPGAVTATEIMLARKRGFKTLAFFPAAASGGPAMIEAMLAPFPDINFYATGGIGAHNAPAYLALRNLPCLGAAWLTPQNLIEAKDWSAITQLALNTAELRA